MFQCTQPNTALVVVFVVTQQPLYFTQSGNGPHSIVFLHYFGGSCRTWQAVIRLLPHAFRCLAIDVPGFGQSPAIERGATVGHVAEAIMHLIGSWRLSSYTLVGHSMGGKLALSIAAQKPPGLERLLLIAPSPPTPEPTTAMQQAHLLQCHGHKAAMEDLVKGLTAKPLPPRQLEEAVSDHLCINSRSWHDWITIGSKENIAAQMKNITVPLHVATGSDDPVFSTQYIQAAFGMCFKEIAYTEIADTGHLVPTEQPQAVADWISEIVAKSG